MIRHLSLFSGIGACRLAFDGLAETVAFAETDAAASRVLARRFPTVPNLGDVTVPDFLDRVAALGRIDLVTAGTPCQAFSVAGYRRGLEDARGNLTVRLLEVCDAIRARGLLFENVPGLLTMRSDPFGAFLGALAGAGRALSARDGSWPRRGVVAGPRRVVAWRVLDAQHFGLAQRRPRLFAVASADPGGLDPVTVLFEPAGVCRDTPAGREAGAGVAGTLALGAGDGGARLAFGGNNTGGPIDVAAAVNAHGGPKGRQDFESETFIAEPMAFDETQVTSAENRSRPQVGTPCHGLAAGARPPAVAFSCKDHGADGWRVRRLTPIECERLQGFPDGWTEPAGADGSRYRCLGNAWPVPVVRWIAERMAP